MILAINTCYKFAVQAVPPPQPGRDDTAVPSARRWALLALQLPATPSNARVKTWRRLQQLGAVPVKNAVYVLPASTQAVEDFAWLGREVEALGGQASVFQADAVGTESDAEIIALFHRSRADDYKALLADLRKFKVRAGRDSARDLRSLRERLEQIRAIDFFAAPGGDDATARLTELERAAHKGRVPDSDRTSMVRLQPKNFRSRLWVTRPRPGVDRFASAWLIRRFIDPEARFDFVTTEPVSSDVLAFDMYDVGFRHEGERCTFEVLLLRFALSDSALMRIAEIVHDLDLKDERYRPAQAPTIGLLVEGLREACSDDHELLQQGMQLFEALYNALSTAHPTRRPSAYTSRRQRKP